MCTALGFAVAGVTIVLAVISGPTVVLWLVGAAGLYVAIYPGLMPLLVWHGLQVRIDDSGVLFGSPRRLPRPPNTFGSLRQAYFAPWEAIRDAQVIVGEQATAAMQQLARPALLTTSNGFFPRKGAPGQLSLVIDHHAATIPWVRVVQGRTWGSGTPTPLNPSRRWVFPVSDVDEVVAAFTERGVPISTTSEPVAPIPCPEWAAAPPPSG